MLQKWQMYRLARKRTMSTFCAVRELCILMESVPNNNFSIPLLVCSVYDSKIIRLWLLSARCCSWCVCFVSGRITQTPSPPSLLLILHFQTTALMMCMVGRWKKTWLSLQVQQVHLSSVTADPENSDPIHQQF